MTSETPKFFNLLSALFLLCLISGILLRIGNPFELSFINDELSTWSKVSYDSVADVIDNIRALDSHPAGMYVFVYFWTSIFGTSEWAIKLPFLLMSFFSMLLVYRIATIWFNKNAALLILAYFCSLQFPVWWSSIARQYQSGLFCTLLMAFFWTKLLVEHSNNKWHWFGFVITGAASMYNHYFSLIFAATIGFSGLFMLRKEILLKYIFAGVAMVLLFVPHWEITAYQLLNADGHKWYDVPGPEFLYNHFFYLFHYSFFCLGLILLVFFSSAYLYGKKSDKSISKLRLTAIFWFLFPLLFGYFYSVYNSPILRTSHLLFSFPYILFFLLSFIPKNLSPKLLTSAVVLVLLVNVSTLVLVRKHFQTTNSHPYKPFVDKTKAFLKDHDRDDVIIVLGENPLYLQYYKNVLNTNFSHIESFKPPVSFAKFRDLLQNSDASFLIIGSLPEAHVRMAMDYFPFVCEKSYGINYEYFILSKKIENKSDSLISNFESELNFSPVKIDSVWSFNPDNVFMDSASNTSFYDMTEEWGPTFDLDLADLTSANQILHFSADVRIIDSADVLSKGVLTIEIYNQKEKIWKGVEIHKQIVPGKDWQRVYLSLRFAHEKFFKNHKDFKIKAYFWNRNKLKIHIKRFNVLIHEGNPLLYGDTDDVFN
jgi:hypothetical protein